MDLFVLASHREGFPRAAMEATAMGLPVVATDIRGCRQVVDDGVTGRLVPVGDAAALAEAVAELAGDADRRAAMGTAGRAKAAREFDQQHCIDVTLALYRQLLEAADGGDRRWPTDRRPTSDGRGDVLAVVTSTDRRGAEVAAVQLGEALAERGLAVTTVALWPGTATAPVASAALDLPTLGRRRHDPAALVALGAPGPVGRGGGRPRLVHAALRRRRDHRGAAGPSCTAASATRPTGPPPGRDGRGPGWPCAGPRRWWRCGRAPPTTWSTSTASTASRIEVIPTGVPAARFVPTPPCDRPQARRDLVGQLAADRRRGPPDTRRPAPPSTPTGR